MKSLRKILNTNAPASVLLIRLVVGGLSVRRRAEVSFSERTWSGPVPQDWDSSAAGNSAVRGRYRDSLWGANHPGSVHEIGGRPVGNRYAVAISTTKIPILLASGFWAMAHEARTDYAMLLGLIFLLIVGAGRWSIDRRLM